MRLLVHLMATMICLACAGSARENYRGERAADVARRLEEARAAARAEAERQSDAAFNIFTEGRHIPPRATTCISLYGWPGGDEAVRATVARKLEAGWDLAVEARVVSGLFAGDHNGEPVCRATTVGDGAHEALLSRPWWHNFPSTDLLYHCPERPRHFWEARSFEHNGTVEVLRVTLPPDAVAATLALPAEYAEWERENRRAERAHHAEYVRLSEQSRARLGPNSAFVWATGGVAKRRAPGAPEPRNEAERYVEEYDTERRDARERELGKSDWFLSDFFEQGRVCVDSVSYISLLNSAVSLENMAESVRAMATEGWDISLIRLRVSGGHHYDTGDAAWGGKSVCSVDWAKSALFEADAAPICPLSRRRAASYEVWNELLYECECHAGRGCEAREIDLVRVVHS